MADKNAYTCVESLEDTKNEAGAIQYGPYKNVRSWPLMEKFYTELKAKPALNTDKPAIAAIEVFLSNAHELYKVKCNVCNGWGHSAKFCTTWPRVKTAAGANKHVQSWLKSASSRVYKDVKPAPYQQPDILGCLAQLPYELPEGFLEKAKKGSKRNAKTLRKTEFV